MRQVRLLVWVWAMTISNESWHDLTAKIENAKIDLIVCRRKIRSENATINFENFVRGFCNEVETVAFLYAQCYTKHKNLTSEYNMVVLMARGAMAIYGKWNPTDSVNITPYWGVKSIPWWEH